MGWVSGGNDNTDTSNNDSGGSSGGGSSSSSSSSSSGGGGGGGTSDPRLAQLEALMRSAYIGLWGEPPTEGYIKQAAHSGMNVTEFVHRERMKEAWSDTKAFKDQFKSLLGALRNMGAA